MKKALTNLSKYAKEMSVYAKKRWEYGGVAEPLIKDV